MNETNQFVLLIRHAIKQSSIEFSNHGLRRASQRGIGVTSILRAIQNGQPFEHLRDAVPYPTIKFRYSELGRELIVVVAWIDEEEFVSVITTFWENS